VIRAFGLMGTQRKQLHFIALFSKIMKMKKFDIEKLIQA